MLTIIIIIAINQVDLDSNHGSAIFLGKLLKVFDSQFHYVENGYWVMLEMVSM